MSKIHWITIATASAIFASPLITGRVLGPGHTFHSGVIVSLASTGQKDTTDHGGNFSLMMPNTPVVQSVQPWKLTRVGLGYKLQWNGAGPVSMQILDAHGQQLQYQTIKPNSSQQIFLATTSRTCFVKLSDSRRVWTFSLLSEGGGTPSSFNTSALMEVMPSHDSLIFADSMGVFAKAQVNEANFIQGDFVFWHRIFKGSYVGPQSQITLAISNSSVGWEQSIQIPANGEYRVSIWRPMTVNDWARGDWGTKYQLQARDVDTLVQQSFDEMDQEVEVPKFGTPSPISSSSSSGGTIYSSMLLAPLKAF